MDKTIENLMKVSLESLKDMIDVNTIVGKPIYGIDSSIILIPISKVKLGFFSGGTDFKNINQKDSNFGGASGGNMTLSPIGFIYVSKSEVKIMHIEESTSITERLIDKFPEAIEQIKTLFSNIKNSEDN